MAFQLHTRKVGLVIVVEAVGRLTLTDGHTKLRDLIHVSTGEGARKFMLNLAQVEYIDSHGVGELVRSYSVIRQTGGELKLACVNQKVLEVSGDFPPEQSFRNLCGRKCRPSVVRRT